MGGALPPLKSAPKADMDFMKNAEPNLGESAEEKKVD
jgi:hypothetical protein